MNSRRHRRRIIHALTTAVAALLLSSFQSVIWHRIGPTPDSSSLSGFPGLFHAKADVNQDGVPDVVVGAPTMDSFRGVVSVLSGTTGEVVHEIDGPKKDSIHGYTAIFVGDLDGDGISEFTSNNTKGPIPVYSGADASVVLEIPNPSLWPWAEGWFPLGTTDLESDGVPDIVLGNFTTSPPGTALAGGVVVVSGVDGAALAHWPGEKPFDRFGWSLANAGDLDGDSVDDFLVGAPGFLDLGQPLELNAKSHASLVSGRTGEELQRFLPAQSGLGSSFNTRFGFAVDTGDTDGDGVSDLLIGESCGFPSGTDIGLALYSGKTGELLHATDDRSGDAVAFVGDVDGDGFGDYAGTRGFHCQPIPCTTIVVYSGSDHVVIYELALQDGLRPGKRLVGPGDMNDDGFPDLLASDEAYQVGPSLHSQGRLTLFSLIPRGVRSFGRGCPGPDGIVPRIGARGSPILGTELQVHLSKAVPGVPAVLLLGFSETEWNGVPLPFGLDFAGRPDCFLLTSVAHAVARFTQPDVPAPGRATVALQVPDDLALVGTELFAQWLVGDVARRPVSMTRALAFELLAE